MPDCRLVIIDPITAYLGRAIECINAEVRRVMNRLNQLATRHRVAILAISHLRKQQGAALHRAMGSLAFVAAARAAWLVTKHPNSQKPENGESATADSPSNEPAHASRRLLLPIKNNFAPDTTGLAFSIDSPLPLPPGEGRGEGREGRGEESKGPSEKSSPRIQTASMPTVEWSPEPIDMVADSVAFVPINRRSGRPDVERQEAVRWLRQQLAAGVRPSVDVEACATANGFKDDTLRRAFRELGGEAVRVGFGPLGEWFWRLPGIGDQVPQPTFADLWQDPPNKRAPTETAV